jgi:hypothetical protein
MPDPVVSYKAYKYFRILKVQSRDIGNPRKVLAWTTFSTSSVIVNLCATIWILHDVAIRYAVLVMNFRR